MKAAGIVSMFVLSGFLISGSTAALAQTSMYKDHTHGEDLHGTFVETEDMSRWSTGVDYLKLDRRVEFFNGGRRGRQIKLESEIYPLQVGLDVIKHWATLYFASGQDITGIDFNNDFKVAGGLKINWWHNDITDPKFMYGRVSIRSNMEYGYYESGTTSGSDLSWTEIYGNLTVNYDKMMAQRISDVWHYPYSMNFYGGAVVSFIKGTESGFLGTSDFEQVQTLGTVVGVDLFLSHNFSAGAKFEYFNELSTTTVSLRYHFH